ncbi:MAG: hypothetical protein N2645_04885 [Clostridia bacterium]|nr:hypothetical protein [Clostridia bacterium]
MARGRFTTTYDSELLRLVREKAEREGLDGASTVIEEALRMYFTTMDVEAWEKQLSGGWFKKLIICNGHVVFESVRIRKQLRYNPGFHNHEVLSERGWKKVHGQRERG